MINRYYSIILLTLLVLYQGCAPTIPQIPQNPLDSYGCEKPFPEVFTAAGVDVKVAESRLFSKVVIGAIDIKSDPQVISLVTKASRDAQIRDYLRCLAIHRDRFTPEQVAYFDLLTAFMQSGPNSEQILRWQKDNPFPPSAPPPIDKVPPKLTCPDDITVEAKSRLTPITFNKSIVAIDNIDPYPRIVYNHNLDSGFPVGMTVVEVKAIDYSNNSSTCTFRVKVIKNPWTFPKYLSLSFAALGGAAFSYLYLEAEDFDDNYLKEWDKNEANKLKKERDDYTSYSWISAGVSGLSLGCFFYYWFKENTFSNETSLYNKYLTKIEYTPQEMTVSLVLNF